jgi:hypothetical protein
LGKYKATWFRTQEGRLTLDLIGKGPCPYVNTIQTENLRDNLASTFSFHYGGVIAGYWLPHIPCYLSLLFHSTWAIELLTRSRTLPRPSSLVQSSYFPAESPPQAKENTYIYTISICTKIAASYSSTNSSSCTWIIACMCIRTTNAFPSTTQSPKLPATCCTHTNFFWSNCILTQMMVDEKISNRLNF